MSRIHSYTVVVLLCILPSSNTAWAHVSEQGFVLLLPTKAYIIGGVLAVAMSAVLLGFVSTQASLRLFRPLKLVRAIDMKRWPEFVSLLSLALLVMLLVLGFVSTRDPLSNLLPLSIWTLWWVGFVSLQGVLGNMWSWVNPWSGLFRLLNKGRRPVARLPEWLGIAPGILVFLVFMTFVLVDVAPDDPTRLAWFVTGYYLFTFTGMWLFGEHTWLHRVECFTMLLNLYALLAAVKACAQADKIDDKSSCNENTKRNFSAKDTTPDRAASTVYAGFPGWAAHERVSRMIALPESDDGMIAMLGLFVLVVLACGSFDGLNETYWWLSAIDVNPLAFPGRSAIVGETVVGLLLANAALLVMFALCVTSGIWLVERQFCPLGISFKRAFGILAIGILPIALAYHFAHYFTTLLVNTQYTWAAASDPLHTGADLLNLGTFYVTTGFFNSRNTVHIIWLVQAGTVVAGHVLSVLLTHSFAVRLFGGGRRAVLCQIPLAVFMVAYTLLGLWLLAAPRGA